MLITSKWPIRERLRESLKREREREFVVHLKNQTILVFKRRHPMSFHVQNFFAFQNQDVRGLVWCIGIIRPWRFTHHRRKNQVNGRQNICRKQ